MIGTVSTDEKAEIARAHGCTHTIVTSREDIAKRVREITDGKGVPVVYDSVGKDTLMASLDSLQPRGTLVSNGTTSGPVVIDTTLLAVKGSIWVTRPAMVHYATPRSHMLDMAASCSATCWPARSRASRSRPSRWPSRRGASRARVAPDGRRHRPQTLGRPNCRTTTHEHAGPQATIAYIYAVAVCRSQPQRPRSRIAPGRGAPGTAAAGAQPRRGRVARRTRSPLPG